VAQLPVAINTSVVVLARAGTYFVRILATVGGAQISSNEIFVIVLPAGVPSAPQELAGTVAGSTVTLSWAPPANEAFASVRTYLVAAGSVPGVSDIVLFPTGSTETTYTATAVANGSYWVRVYAESASGLSPASNDIRVNVGPAAPGAPVLSGGATGPGAVLLQWTAAPAPALPVTGYRLLAGFRPGQSDAAVIDLPASSLAYGAAGIAPGIYYVRVAALSAAGLGDLSNEVVVTIP
jgi:hypothetical protein